MTRKQDETRQDNKTKRKASKEKERLTAMLISFKKGTAEFCCPQEKSPVVVVVVVAERR
jgi:hypothetical protein